MEKIKDISSKCETEALCTMLTRTHLWLPREMGGSGMGWEFELNRCKLLEWLSSELLLHSTGNCTLPFVREHDGG